MIDYNNHKIINNKKETTHMENVVQKIEKSIPEAIKIDEKEVFDHLDTLVRQSVEDTINALLDAEARLRHISTTKWGTRQSSLQNIRNGCIIRKWHNFYRGNFKTPQNCQRALASICNRERFSAFA